ncbi:hypothetical protein EVAR_39918_1 [Eumeta japonica]|uniref:Uncharacterized protein n=1 Tax=Eumeta variegata TaxID=151549 RepID=A0A4C1WQ52_EUMVA|nr:hypothetical protein EVAR_39918_1 [Eumeta japonica]
MKVESMRWKCDLCVVFVESLKNRFRKSDVRERRGLKKDVMTGFEKGVLRWLGHLDRMNESRLTKQIYRANMCGGKVEIVPTEPRMCDLPDLKAGFAVAAQTPHWTPGKA